MVFRLLVGRTPDSPTLDEGKIPGLKIETWGTQFLKAERQNKAGFESFPEPAKVCFCSVDGNRNRLRQGYLALQLCIGRGAADMNGK